MPTYVYRREDGSTFEIDQRITEDALTTCPETGQKAQRIITGSAGLIFKGSGFYLTDYARGNGEGAKQNGDGKGESKAETGKGGEKTGAGEKVAASSETGKGASGSSAAKSEGGGSSG